MKRPPVLPGSGRTPAERRRAWLRGLQLGGLTLGALCWGGAAWLTFGAGKTAGYQTEQRPEFTFLLAGRDVAYCGYHLRCEDQTQREGLFQEINTDTLMLIKVTGPRVEVLNIPRDTNVGEYDPDKTATEQKINHQYWADGPYALKRGVETITGSPVDAYVVLNEDYVAELIDALGGLTVTVPEGGIQWEDNAAGIHLDLPPGEQHLDGRTAALYLRVRKGVGDDWGRIDHQKQALTQLIGKLRSPQGLRVIPTLISGFGENIETDLSPERLTGMLPYLSQLNLTFATLPTTSIPDSFNLAVDRAALSRVWTNPGLEAERQEAERQEQLEQARAEGTDQTGETAEETVDGLNDERGDLAADGPADLTELPVVIHDGSGALLGPALARSLERVGYGNVRVLLEPPDPMSSQVLTLDAPAEASALAQLLSLPRLQGERFELQNGEVAVWLGTDAQTQLAALKPLRRPTDGRQLGLTREDAAALLQATPLADPRTP
ncbi:LytR family transcriptional regulator [Deinococcus piscis]|uniref:LytR family transcriptional regulator n=1 Tax=Deinococcus piscis TaxID=394230 RepID=A0ABQ3K5F5_9DEIO|nr:LCP family protein [Deinococcus piscis]GHG04369.1 LytR family transcriptional regulator [Deinococcus piscis]